MCVDPVSLAAIGTVAAIAGTAATVVGTGVSIYSSLKTADANVRAAQASADQDVRLANFQLEQGKKAEAEQRTKTQSLIGRQRALMAASNLDLSSGSPLTILADTAQFGEQDAQQIRSNARNNANTYRNQADLTLAGGQDAQAAGVIGAISAGVSGLSTLSGKWYDTSLKQAPVVGRW